MLILTLNFLVFTNAQSLKRDSWVPVLSLVHHVHRLVSVPTLRCLSALNFHASSLC